jgi:DNA-binding transcriptional MocR family regulator
MADISDLPMLHDIDADYTPQYVKLARIVRDKIQSGQYQRGDALPAPDLANEHGVSIKVAWSALAMLAANRYITCPGNFIPTASPGREAHDGRPITPYRPTRGRRMRRHRREHPRSAPAQGMKLSQARRPTGWPTKATVCGVRRRRPPQRPTTRINHRRGRTVWPPFSTFP